MYLVLSSVYNKHMNYLLTKAEDFQNKINNAPREPGCYLYLDNKGKIIYIGKAKVIKNRVKSYFINYSKLDSKVQAMLEHAFDIDFITVDSEVEALILETNLIKKYRPKYNILMRDDKNYNWIKVEKAIKGKRDFPRIRIIREKDDPKAEYFGPYPSKLPLKNILIRIRKVFPYVSCNRRLIQVTKNPLNIDTNNNVPCLYYHIGLCQAPCASNISKEEYIQNFNNIRKFLSGQKIDILKELEQQMKELSKNFEFEKAALVRDKINDIKYVTKNMKIDNEVDDVVINDLKENERTNAINQLIEELNFPKDKLQNHSGFKIECYDISNIQGTNAVGSMTVMVDGQLRKDLYRKFKIQMKNEPNDFAMLQEVLSRRFSHLDTHIFDENLTKEITNIEVDPSFSIKPDLIIIDGGKGQLAVTFEILKRLGLSNDIPIVGLAKREEEIFKVQWQFNQDEWPGIMIEETVTPNSSNLGIKRFKRIMLPRRSEALFLVQRIRDEAHRFGITYHRKLRSKQMLNRMKKSTLKY